MESRRGGFYMEYASHSEFTELGDGICTHCEYLHEVDCKNTLGCVPDDIDSSICRRGDF